MRPGVGQNPAAERMVRLQIRQRDIVDERVCAAMQSIPRHLFVPPGCRASAYEDHPVSIGHGQTISQPYMVAFMTQVLQMRAGARTLEIGTGSGYQTAVLAELCAEVFSIERIPDLAERAARILAELGYDNVSLRTADGSEGWPEQAPFDRILVTAAAPSVPTALMNQLSDNGILVLPVGDWKRTQDLVIARRTAGVVSMERSVGCRFVPLIGSAGFPDQGR
jgi:protein-L-isoaspartate(D-aspartate) O-methyltransferase